MRLTTRTEHQGLHVRTRFLSRQVSDAAADAAFGVICEPGHIASLRAQAVTFHEEANAFGLPLASALLANLTRTLDSPEIRGETPEAEVL